LGNSLQDQLLKAGLVDQKKVNRQKKAKQQKEKQQRHAKQKSVDESKQRAQQAMQQNAQRDRELNRQRQDAANQKAISAQIRQLVEMNAVSIEEGDTAYNFTDDSKVQRIHVTELVHSQLVRGQLAIVKIDGMYQLVPAGVAEKIAQRDEGTVIVCNQSDEAEDSDDPYAEYKVPDDLMW
jgi:uncharacterized protein YaiL (DUF2058 family)